MNLTMYVPEPSIKFSDIPVGAFFYALGFWPLFLKMDTDSCSDDNAVIVGAKSISEFDKIGMTQVFGPDTIIKSFVADAGVIAE